MTKTSTSIRLNDSIDIYVFKKRTMNAQRYCQDVTMPHMHNFWGAIGNCLMFMDHNFPCQREAYVNDLES